MKKAFIFFLNKLKKTSDLLLFLEKQARSTPILLQKNTLGLKPQNIFFAGSSPYFENNPREKIILQLTVINLLCINFVYIQVISDLSLTLQT